MTEREREKRDTKWEKREMKWRQSNRRAKSLRAIALPAQTINKTLATATALIIVIAKKTEIET